MLMNYSRLAARKYARIVQKLGFPTKFKDFKIQNMVSFVLMSGNNNFSFRLVPAMSNFLFDLRAWC